MAQMLSKVIFTFNPYKLPRAQPSQLLATGHSSPTASLVHCQKQNAACAISLLPSISFFLCSSCNLQKESSWLLLLPRDPRRALSNFTVFHEMMQSNEKFHSPLFFTQQVAHTCDLLQLLRIKLTFHFGSETQGVHARHGSRVYTQGPLPGRRKLNSTSFLSCLLNKLPLNPCT